MQCVRGDNERSEKYCDLKFEDPRNQNYPLVSRFITWYRPFIWKRFLFGISQLWKRGNVLAAARQKLVLPPTEQDQAHSENNKVENEYLEADLLLIHAFPFSVCADWDWHTFMNINALLQTSLKIDCLKVTNSHLNDLVSTKLKTRAKRTFRNTTPLFEDCNGRISLLTSF